MAAQLHRGIIAQVSVVFCTFCLLPKDGAEGVVVQSTYSMMPCCSWAPQLLACNARLCSYTCTARKQNMIPSHKDLLLKVLRAGCLAGTNCSVYSAMLGLTHRWGPESAQSLCEGSRQMTRQASEALACN